LDPQKPCLTNCELFGKHAAYFESTIVPLWQEGYDSLVSRAHVKEGSATLDVGTGTGEVALRLGRLVGGSGRVVAIDAQPEMLQIAKQKAKERGVRNIEFKESTMELMNLTDDSFDSVLGHYSLCCCSDYRATLEECLRVLKRGGRLTYNHSGPNDPLPFQVISKIFENYKTKRPSKKLEELRIAELSQFEAVDKYTDPFVTLEEMRSVGFSNAEATLSKRSVRYDGVAAYIDEWIMFDWVLEAEEISDVDLQRFRKEATDALTPLSEGPGFKVERDTIFFTGVKR
jgi:ubiquinone/menaquinone biosynthesis C-methylase UbiE